MNQKPTDRNTDNAEPKTPATDKREIVENDRDSVTAEGNGRSTHGHHTEEKPLSKKGGTVKDPSRPTQH